MELTFPATLEFDTDGFVNVLGEVQDALFLLLFFVLKSEGKHKIQYEP